jgi:excisionase family DNA binding protein
MTNREHSDLISTAQAAGLLGKDVRTVHRMIRRGELPAEKLPGRRGAYLIHRADVDTILTPAGARGVRSAS